MPQEVPSPRRILVVEEEAAQRTRLCLELARGGFAVAAASDGLQAYDAVFERPCDLVASSVRIPLLDGWELFERLRAHLRTSLVPFVFLTRAGSTPRGVRGLSMGADAFVGKTPPGRDLVHAVERALLQVAAARDYARRLGQGSGGTFQDQILGFHAYRKTGCLRGAADGGRMGRLCFHAGEILDASTGERRGEEALHEMCGWRVAIGYVEPLPPDALPARTVHRPTDGILRAFAPGAPEGPSDPGATGPASRYGF